MDSMEKNSERCLESQLWHACAGATVQMPRRTRHVKNLTLVGTSFAHGFEEDNGHFWWRSLSKLMPQGTFKKYQIFG
jgi:hypothetical protein